MQDCCEGHMVAQGTHLDSQCASSFSSVVCARRARQKDGSRKKYRGCRCWPTSEGTTCLQA
jgi:hypothetical protein